MALIHELNCASTRKNTGFGAGCPLDWKLFAGAIIWDGPVTFEASWLANFAVWLQANAWQNLPGGVIGGAPRGYPIGNFLNPEDATEKPTIQTFSDGSKAKVRDGTYDWTFDFTAGGFPLLQALQTHDGNSTEYAIFYDKNNNVLGWNNNGKFAAIPLQIFDALPWMMNDGSKTAKYSVHFVFAKQYANDFAEYFNAGFNMGQVVGLQDIRIVVNGWNQATGLANVTFLTENGGTNLYSLYSAEFNTTTLGATNGDTGAVLPITSVTPIVSNQTFNIQFPTGNANYPSDGNIVLAFALPSVLAANGLVGFAGESAILDVTSS
jgi:hypothetical protein